MDAHLTPGRGGLPHVQLRHSSGATVEVYLHGATVTSYVSAVGQPLLFVSSEAVFDGVKPIRGGIPLVFPQFAMQGPLPMHGFARTSSWTLEEVGDGMAVLSLRDSEATRALWAHAFRLRLRITFDEARLATHLDVENPKEATEPFAFEALQHSYFLAGTAEDAAARLTLAGLGGVTFLDKPRGAAPFVESSDPMRLEGEVDRIYCNTPCVWGLRWPRARGKRPWAHVMRPWAYGMWPRALGTRTGRQRARAYEALSEGGQHPIRYCAPHSRTRAPPPPRSADIVVAGITSGAEAASPGTRFTSIVVKRRATLRPSAPALSQVVEGCPLDVVVWNPGPVRARAILDLGDEDWRHYVCVEPGRVSPATATHHAATALPPGRVWTLTQEVLMVA